MVRSIAHPEIVNILIAEDETAARERMKDLLAELTGYDVVDEAATGPEAVAKIQALRPDLVLLDISLPEWNGFEVIARVPPALLPLTIFTTAYDQYALRAFDVHAVDYLLKPVERPRLAEALARARERLQSRDLSNDPRRHMIASWSASRVAVRMGDRVVVLDPGEIEWLEALGNYTKLHTASGKVVARHSLSALESRLEAHGFLRVHRSYVVNRAKVTAIVRESKDVYSILLSSGARVRIGDRFRTDVDKLFGILA